MPNPPRGTYLCVFDNVSLSDPVRVGDFDIRRYTVPELTDLLRGRDDSVPSPAEQRELEHLSWCVWARIELPIDGQSFLGAGGVAELSDMDWARVNFYAQGTFGDPTEPLDKLLRALNLHKPNNGPVFVCDLYLRPAQSIQSKRQVSRIVFSEPMTVPSPPEGKEVPLLRGYYLTMDDGIAISGLVEQLDRCFASNPDRRDATHLRVALHYFRRADERMSVQPTEFGALEPLMAYEAALEALTIREDERGVEGRLEKRLCAVMDASLSKYECGRRSPSGVLSRERRRVTVADLGNFVRRVFWLRSKFAHGARTIEELARLVTSQPEAAIPAEKTGEIPTGPYSCMLVDDDGPFPGFLVNLRELARRTIRFFLDDPDERSRDETLRRLDR